MYTIKTLTKSNLFILINAAEGVFDNPVDESLAVEFLDDPRHHMVAAIVDDVIVGVASAVHYIHPDKPPELWINEVGVAPSHQGQGIGKALMKEMLRLGNDLGCKTAWTLTESDNSPANRLYKSAGREVNGGNTIMYEFEIDNS